MGAAGLQAQRMSAPAALPAMHGRGPLQGGGGRVCSVPSGLGACWLAVAVLLMAGAPAAASSAAQPFGAARRTAAAKLRPPSTPQGATNVVGRLARLSDGTHAWALTLSQPASLKGMHVTLRLPANVRLPAAWKPGADATLRGTYRLVAGWPSAFTVTKIVKVAPRFGAASKLYEPGLKSVTVYLVTVCARTQTLANGQQPTAAVSSRARGATSGLGGWGGVPLQLNHPPPHHPQDLTATYFTGDDSLHGTWQRCSFGRIGLNASAYKFVVVPDVGCVANFK